MASYFTVLASLGSRGSKPCRIYYVYMRCLRERYAALYRIELIGSVPLHTSSSGQGCTRHVTLTACQTTPPFSRE